MPTSFWWSNLTQR